MSDCVKYLTDVMQRLGMNPNAASSIVLTAEDEGFSAHLQVGVPRFWAPLLAPNDGANSTEIYSDQEGDCAPYYLSEQWCTCSSYRSKAQAKQALATALLACFPKPFPFLSFRRIVIAIEHRWPLHSMSIHLRPLSREMIKRQIIFDPAESATPSHSVGFDTYKGVTFPRTSTHAQSLPTSFQKPTAPSLYVSLSALHTIALLRALMGHLNSRFELQPKALLFQLLIKLWQKKEWGIADPKFIDSCSPIETMTPTKRKRPFPFTCYSKIPTPSLNGNEQSPEVSVLLGTTRPLATMNDADVHVSEASQAGATSNIKKESTSLPSVDEFTEGLAATPRFAPRLNSTYHETLCLQYRVPTFIRSDRPLPQMVEWTHAHPCLKLPCAKIRIFPVPFDPFVSKVSPTVSVELSKSKSEEVQSLSPVGIMRLAALQVEIHSLHATAAKTQSKEISNFLHGIGLIVLLNLLFSNKTYKNVTFGLVENIVRQNLHRISRTLDSKVASNSILSTEEAVAIKSLRARVKKAPPARFFLPKLIEQLKIPKRQPQSRFIYKLVPVIGVWSVNGIYWPVCPVTRRLREVHEEGFLHFGDDLRTSQGIDLLTQTFLALESVVMGVLKSDEVDISFAYLQQTFAGDIEPTREEIEETCATGLICLIHLGSVTRLKLQSALSILLRVRIDPETKFEQFEEHMIWHYAENSDMKMTSRLETIAHGSRTLAYSLHHSFEQPSYRFYWYSHVQSFLMARYPEYFILGGSDEMLSENGLQRDAEYQKLLHRLELAGIDMQNAYWPSVEKLLSAYLREVLLDDIWVPLHALLTSTSDVLKMWPAFADDHVAWQVKNEIKEEFHSDSKQSHVTTDAFSLNEPHVTSRSFNTSIQHQVHLTYPLTPSDASIKQKNMDQFALQSRQHSPIPSTDVLTNMLCGPTPSKGAGQGANKCNEMTHGHQNESDYHFSRDGRRSLNDLDKSLEPVESD